MNISKAMVTFFIVISPIIGVLAPRAFGFIPTVLGIITLSEYLFTYRKLPKVNKPLLGFMGVFLTLALASYFWAINPDFVLKRVAKLSLLIIPGLFLLFTAQSVNIVHKKYLAYLPYTLILASLLLLIETYLNYPLYHLIRGIPVDSAVVPAVINWGLVILSFSIWPTMWYLSSTKNKTLMIALLATVTLAILSATNQSAIIAIILGHVALCLSIKVPKAMLYTIAAAVILGIFASPWIAQMLFNARPEALLNWTNASAAQRMELWDFIARYALESPLYGWGIESTRHIHDFDSAQIFYRTTDVIHPHNFALQLWIELGVLGALTGVGFICVCVKNFSKYDTKQMPFIIAAFTAILVVNLVGYGMWQGWLIGIEFMVALTFIAFFKESDTTT